MPRVEAKMNNMCAGFARTIRLTLVQGLYAQHVVS